MNFDDIEKILVGDDKINIYTKLSYFSLHIKDYSQETALNLIKYILKNKPDSFIEKTECRKLFIAYSLRYEQIVKKI